MIWSFRIHIAWTAGEEIDRWVGMEKSGIEVGIAAEGKTSWPGRDQSSLSRLGSGTVEAIKELGIDRER